MLMQNLGVTNKEHYGMLWYFLEWSIRYVWNDLLQFGAVAVHAIPDSFSCRHEKLSGVVKTSEEWKLNYY